MRIALFLSGITDKPGGAERFFGDIYDYYTAGGEKPVYLLCDKRAKASLQSLGRLKKEKKLLLFTLRHNRFKNMIELWSIWWLLFSRRIDLLHVGNYGTHHLPLLRFLGKLPRFLRPKIVVNIEDLRVGLTYGDPVKGEPNGVNRKYAPLFNEINLDGVFCWYRSFRLLYERKPFIRSKPVIGIASYCFTDVRRFTPAAEKQNEIVFAGRMIDGKRPHLFVEAVHILQTQHRNAVKDWHFRIFGDGYLQAEIDKQIETLGLQHVLRRNYVADLAPVYAQSKCFVSAQEDENFTSLAMLEAMAAGNAVIAFNVGQTDFFAQHDKNGLLVNEETAAALAAAMLQYIRHPEHHARYQAESIRIATEVHNVKNFTEELYAYWQQVMKA